MLTVIVCFEGSGKRSTLKPFESRYSVIPSTDVTRSIPLGSAGFWAGVVIDAMATSANAESRAEIFILVFMVLLQGLRKNSSHRSKRLCLWMCCNYAASRLVAVAFYGIRTSL